MDHKLVEHLQELRVGGVPVDGDGDPDADSRLSRQLDERSNPFLSVFALLFVRVMILVSMVMVMVVEIVIVMAIRMKDPILLCKTTD